jgi:hypothetical protein
VTARRLLHVDASAGASGDMILGALVDMGLEIDALRAALASLPVTGFRISARRVRRNGIAARKVDVTVRGPQPERGWREIRSLLDAARLDPPVRRLALSIFRRLIEAEAAVHGVPPSRVHLHEVGAVDAIVDVVGASLGFVTLGAERIVVSRMTTGFGSVQCAHGTYPVPAPATARLVLGAPVEAGPIEGERLTPTGAAILTTVAGAWGGLPAIRPRAVGYGAGSKTFPGSPNLLRMTWGDAEPDAVAPEVIVAELTLDDATPQNLSWAAEQLFAAGALEVFTTPVVMKKGRAGHTLTVLARPEALDAVAEAAFRETTTLGLRYRRESRLELERRTDTVRTRFGPVRVKVGLRRGAVVQAWPEFEDCAAAARRRGVPLKDVQRAALEAHRSLEEAP